MSEKITTMHAQNMQQVSSRQRVIKGIVKAGTYAFLLLMALIVLFPFYWMILTSVKSYSSYNSEFIPQLFTLSPTLQNYLDAFTQVPLADYFLNTLIFTLATTATNTFPADALANFVSMQFGTSLARSAKPVTLSQRTLSSCRI